jgi:glycosyltransferase involved in cell wall biosynthesis
VTVQSALAVNLSVIIPTRGRPDVLRDCLLTLCRQDAAPDQMEIVVVDDGSPDELNPVVVEVTERCPCAMRCVRQAPSGLNVARNHGVDVTSGAVLAFLDDDTLVSPGWARAMLSAFEDCRCSAVGGRVELQLEADPPDWLAPRRYYLAEYDLGDQAHWLEDEPVPVGANCAVRRSEFVRVGGFREGLDRIGSSLVSNGDTEFFRRLRAQGGRQRYEPHAHVRHRVSAERLTFEFFLRRHYAQGVSDELMSAVETGSLGRRRVGRLMRDLSRDIPSMTNTVLRDVLRGRGLVNARFLLSYWRGRFACLPSGDFAGEGP